MNLVDRERFQQEYSAGKDAFERGNYQTSVQRLETAYSLVTPSTRLGGEVGIWLVTAYQAASQITDAHREADLLKIALCTKLSQHPHPEIRKQGKRLLYILQAPALKRPKEWMVEIPDLGALPDSDPKDRRGSSTIKPKPSYKVEEPLDLSQVNTQDNSFVWLAFVAIILMLGSLWWLS